MAQVRFRTWGHVDRHGSPRYGFDAYILDPIFNQGFPCNTSRYFGPYLAVCHGDLGHPGGHAGYDKFDHFYLWDR